jgi:cobalt transporter subunit CbtA
VPLAGSAAFRQIVWSALLAGIVAGMLTTLLQWVTTVPLIAQAEKYEQHALAAQPARAHEPALRSQADHAHEQSAHGHPDWQPEEGLERAAYTALTTVLAAIGYALLVAAVMSFTRTTGIRAGLGMGIAGFIVFQFAPALGLPPELPGVPVPELLPRQLWWLGTATSTAFAVACWYRAWRGRKGAWIAAGIVLFIVPHLIGAPHAPAQATPVPSELARQFSRMAILAAAAFWLVLGGLVGFLHGKFVSRSIPGNRR